MNKFTRIAAVAALFSLPLPALAAPTPALMYKNPNCSCCETYAAYLEQNGFKVDIKPTDDLSQVSEDLGVPRELEGCHAVLIEGYVVDGFVPVEAVRKMLAERPAITGIAVSGMPMGTPGMGMDGATNEPLTSYAFVKGGGAPTVFSVN